MAEWFGNPLSIPTAPLHPYTPTQYIHPERWDRTRCPRHLQAPRSESRLERAGSWLSTDYSRTHYMRIMYVYIRVYLHPHSTCRSFPLLRCLTNSQQRMAEHSLDLELTCWQKEPKQPRTCRSVRFYTRWARQAHKLTSRAATPSWVQEPKEVHGVGPPHS